MKKKLMMTALVLILPAMAMGDVYTFEDIIDTWGILGTDAVYVSESNPLCYTHDLNQEVDFEAGDYIIEAYLELDFTNSDLLDIVGDAYKIKGWVQYDGREFVTVAITKDGVLKEYDAGEQDDGQYVATLNIDWLNDDGLLDVTISVANYLGKATIWLDHSRLYGTAVSAVPVPGSMLLAGLGLGAVSSFRRRRFKA